jgi:hypothetical protein
VSTLGDLEAFEHAEELISRIDFYWEDAKLSRRIAISLGKLCNSDSQWAWLQKYLTHPDYAVRFEAARAIHQSGKQFPKQAPDMELLIRHVQEPLLRAS